MGRLFAQIIGEQCTTLIDPDRAQLQVMFTSLFHNPHRAGDLLTLAFGLPGVDSDSAARTCLGS
jgi:hypothetical protein